MSLLRIFRREDYESDVTQFISELKSQDPSLESRQRAGRAIWWDKNLDREAIREWQEAKVPQKPYVYGTDPSQD
ncbi:DUF3460 family protein [Ramlibacter albus]|uniref:DUF3460 family protein n=1 Tax=Ramlibacter albus TaxID=2079448 RepID=A0A923M7T0_9BURK|nr:DUF3460 family protein [Ramlibacter albus]MBC5765423.1 DUF3460 family protein [Ramlibacter albus]